jgi:hypothetical protein
MKRRRVVIGLVMLALAGAAIYALVPRGPRPCRETFEQVQEGMTYDEVCATVGGPPDDYAPGLRRISPTGTLVYGGARAWWSEDARLLVYYDESGRVEYREVCEVICLPDSRTFLERLRDRLGL